MSDWKVWKYDSYEEYVRAQIAANHRKQNNVWVEKKTIEKIHTHCPNAKHVLCHGTRNGAEMNMFNSVYEKCVIIGTEISDTAEKFNNTVQWDFHEVNADWEGKMDVVYSNSFDHSYDPEKCLTTWRDQLNDDGRLVIEFQDQPMKYSDPLEMSSESFEKLFSQLSLEIDLKTTGSHGVDLYFLKKS
jgi:hypothetical protein